MPGLLVVSGPPGAGKSTVAALLAEDGDRTALVAGDLFFSFLRRGAVAPWLPEAEAHNEVVTQAAARATGRLADGWLLVVYDGVVLPRRLPSFLAATERSICDYAVLLPAEAECLGRVAGRIGHGFTDPDAAAGMHREFRTADVDPRHVVVTGGPPAEVADAVRARWARGELTWTAG